MIAASSCYSTPRIRTTRYGATFLDSLPPYARTDDITAVERFFTEFPKEQ